MTKGPMPWDMVVFLTVTTLGFGFTVQKITQRTPVVKAAIAEELSANESAITVPGSPKQTLDLGCLERRLSGDKVNSQDGAIRIKGKFCNLSKKAMKGFDGIRVKNLTNGYEGTIFFQGYDSAFVTDFMVLASGKNEIQIEWRETHDSQPRTFVAEVFEK